MDFLDLLVERIEKKILEYGTVKKWRTHVGLSSADEATISKLRKKNGDFRLSSLLKIIDALDCEIRIHNKKKG